MVSFEFRSPCTKENLILFMSHEHASAVVVRNRRGGIRRVSGTLINYALLGCSDFTLSKLVFIHKLSIIEARRGTFFVRFLKQQCLRKYLSIMTHQTGLIRSGICLSARFVVENINRHKYDLQASLTFDHVSFSNSTRQVQQYHGFYFASLRIQLPQSLDPIKVDIPISATQR